MTRETGWPQAIALAAGLYAAVGGMLTLCGWTFRMPRLTDWLGDGISMFPNTAMCAVVSGVVLLLRRTSAVRVRSLVDLGACFVALVGGLTLLEHLTGIAFGIDTLLFHETWGQAAAAAPMRMGPPASTAFLLIGLGFLLMNRGPRARAWGAFCGVAVVAIAILPLTGRLYGAQQMYMIPSLTGIASQTATMLLLLGIGMVMTAPDVEPMRTVLEPGAAGVLVRRALPIVVVTALTIGFVRVTLQHHGLVDTAFGTAARTIVEIVLVVVLLWWAAGTVRTHDQALRSNEVELRRQSDQLRAFLETAAIGIHQVGPDGTILWVNEAELQTLGYSREEYVGRHITEFHADRAAIEDILVRLHRGEKIVERLAQMRCKDGSLKTVLIDSSVLWEDGRFIHTQCFTRDVTERMGAEQTRALLAGIVEATDDAVVSKTLQGIITSWNAGAERIFGHTAAEAIGQSIDLVIPDDRRAEEAAIIDRLRRGDRIDHFETVRRTKDGRLIDVSLTISPVRDAFGRVVGASKIARDISERKRHELEREESDRRKDEFIAILAHELRNPLAPVRHAARYLKIKGLPHPDFKRPIEMIERQVAQMSRLIDDLLDVSRISRGMLELRRERCVCAEVVEAAVDACRDDTQAKRHELQVYVPAEPLELEADRERLVQVLCNLIGNAVKYTPTGGRIEVAVGVSPRDTLQVSVKDNGIGIPPEKQREIFDLFARLDHPLEHQGGLGIGLTLVRQLVELHGGTIEARSEGQGQGSEFVVDLPVLVTSPSATADVIETRPSAEPLRIVIADDNADAVESLTLLLEMGGHEVRGALDGEAAIAAIEAFRPDVALIDLGMPKANGYDVARWVRAQSWGAEVHLVALTGWGQEADKRRTREAGFDAHLVKPIAHETLEQLLASVGESRHVSTATG